MPLPPELVPLADAIAPERVERVLAALDHRMGSVVAVAESVRRRHNASAILRSAEAFGVHEVHLVTAGFRAAAGASRSSERWVRTRVFGSTAGSLGDLKARGFRVLVADFAADAWTPETMPVDRPLAILFGSELRGVSDTARSMADGAVTIPMAGLTRSLNVSVSAAILLRAAVDRRKARVGPDLDPAERHRWLAEWVRAEAEARTGFLARTDPEDGFPASSVDPLDG